MHLGRALGFACVFVTATSILATPAAADANTSPQAAISRDLGLTAQQAQQRFASQTEAAAVESTLTDTLGEAFGGAYFDDTTNTLVVGVTERAAAATVRAEGAHPTLVRYSMRELDAIKSALDRRAPAAGVTGWYVDVRSNRVVVEVNRARADAATDAYLAEVRRTSPAVQVSDVTESPRALSHVRGGDQWTTLAWRCSVGFSATGAGGTKHFVTAGHCTQGAGPAFGHDDEQMGMLGGSTFSYFGDYGKVDVTSAGWTLTNLVNRYGGTDVVVRGSTEAPVGASVCRSGSTTGWHCGRIEARNQTVVYIDGAIVSGLTQTTACAEPGDSGGSFVAGDQAQGMTSGGSGDCTDGGETFYQPVNEALDAYGLTLVTSTTVPRKPHS
ncbi:S1 family peptidase [Actinophytocola sp. NPDC049390]|uniref:S1 family peptidase n=1 Tax=Actinophytocola sp. NPDC049390 TaxID=3363894 RepID=UPI0037887CAF